MSHEGFKVKFDYIEPSGVNSQVPGEQKLRGQDFSMAEVENGVLKVDEETGIKIMDEEPGLSPVITITKKEYTYSKGPTIDLKLQKITVKEDISINYRHLVKRETQKNKSVTTEIQTFDYKLK